MKISTHTPHARRDFSTVSESSYFLIFQLTRLMRGVTANVFLRCVNLIQFQLTRLMRGVTQNLLLENILTKISTHTPHARRDR